MSIKPVRRDEAIYYMVLSFVQIMTLSDWSNDVDTAKPNLSELQWKLDIGCVDKPTFCKSSRLPGTPISAPLESFAVRDGNG